VSTASIDLLAGPCSYMKRIQSSKPLSGHTHPLFEVHYVNVDQSGLGVWERGRQVVDQGHLIGSGDDLCSAEASVISAQQKYASFEVRRSFVMPKLCDIELLHSSCDF
jgi:hypothetical protein